MRGMHGLEPRLPHSTPPTTQGTRRRGAGPQWEAGVTKPVTFWDFIEGRPAE
jgi:hypothetical protein